ncbi:hypothetical protein EVAR_56671_1 [Eumeta japonica]|uniref:Uncharacterized protein n=1 Tax=Eumeta variegata TaxID=151549 RepID=A0A4C1YXR9_EUMVA|nr:hypothetical protein EVAR_56671_1 [Eumeta japonica]
MIPSDGDPSQFLRIRGARPRRRTNAEATTMDTLYIPDTDPRNSEPTIARRVRSGSRRSAERRSIDKRRAPFAFYGGRKAGGGGPRATPCGTERVLILTIVRFYGDRPRGRVDSGSGGRGREDAPPGSRRGRVRTPVDVCPSIVSCGRAGERRKWPIAPRARIRPSLGVGGVAGARAAAPLVRHGVKTSVL